MAARRVAAGAHKSSAALDRVIPPPGCDDPTLVVWRRYGRRRDLYAARSAVYVIYLAIMAWFTVLLRFDTFALVGDLIIAVIGIGHAFLQFSPLPYYAAGASWIINWSDKIGGPTTESERRRGTQARRFANTARIDIRYARNPTPGLGMESIMLTHDDGSTMTFSLDALRACPPLVALLTAGLGSRPDLDVHDDSLDQLTASGKRTGKRIGHTVTRPDWTNYLHRTELACSSARSSRPAQAPALAPAPMTDIVEQLTTVRPGQVDSVVAALSDPATVRRWLAEVDERHEVFIHRPWGTLVVTADPRRRVSVLLSDGVNAWSGRPVASAEEAGWTPTQIEKIGLDALTATTRPTWPHWDQLT